jgi:putative aldouronate transport system permease protein
VLIFNYGPLYGLQIAFKNYKVSLGMWNSRFVGFRNFIDFFNGYNFWTLIKNTLGLSLYEIVIGFPIPIFVALVLNEMGTKSKRVLQTVLYAPHFISTVVLVGIINVMFSPSMGVVNTVIEALGGDSIYFMGKPEYFRHIYAWSGRWQEMGWSAIIYLAALSSVDPAHLEAAEIDGATRLQKIRYINIPTILPTIIITLILKFGRIVTVGYEKVYLLQNELNLDVSEVISTYVYRLGLQNFQYSFSTAVGLFNSAINILFVLTANKISKKLTDVGLI